MRASHRLAPKRNSQQIRRYFAECIADKKQPGADAIDCGAEMEVAIHAQGSEADVDAIHVGQPVTDGDDRQESNRSLPLGRRPIGIRVKTGLVECSASRRTASGSLIQVRFWTELGEWRTAEGMRMYHSVREESSQMAVIASAF